LRDPSRVSATSLPKFQRRKDDRLLERRPGGPDRLLSPRAYRVFFRARLTPPSFLLQEV
jgi:hypothetical protein